MAAVVMCQLLAGMPVSLAAVHDPVRDGGMDMSMNMDMSMDMDMDMTDCPDQATHQDHSDKHGCCSDAGCQCIAPAGAAAALPQVIYRVLAPRTAPESDTRTATLRIDLFLRPPIA